MRLRGSALGPLALGLLLGGPAAGLLLSGDWKTAQQSGGAASSYNYSSESFSIPILDLEPAARARFAAGRALFNTTWVPGPPGQGSSGLGPLFNAESCAGCHRANGRARPPDGPADAPSAGLVVRFLPADPVYGRQLNPHAVPGSDGEGTVRLEWREDVTLQAADGTVFRLRRPVLLLDGLRRGPLAPATHPAIRTAPATFGLGLLEAVPEELLRRLEDPADADGDGVSGRIRWIDPPCAGEKAVGRFGWKASHPDLLSTALAAFEEDLGVCPKSRAPGCGPVRCEPAEVFRDQLADLEAYSRTLAVPARSQPSPPALRGAETFERVGCAGCHTPTLVTGSASLPALSHQVIHPYTDLLLHDLGEGLADPGAEPNAQGAEWRTPPLWGIGLIQRVNGHQLLLHDGRARGLLEAVLWHGGEAQASRNAVLSLSAAERDDLIAFLKSL